MFLQFESFGVSCEFDRTNAFAVGRVDYAKPTVAKADVNLLCGAVVTYVVCIILEVHSAERLPGFGVINIAQPALVVCYEEPV